MYKISFENNLSQKELTNFLTKVDDYFTISLHNSCKQPNLYIWAGALLKKASFVIARNGDEEIVGCLIFYPNNVGDFIYVSIAVVLKEYQHNHIAALMFESLVSYARDFKRLGIHLHTYSTNLKALAFYNAIGFIKKEADGLTQLTPLYKTIC